MLVACGFRAVLSQTSLVSQLVKYLTLDQAVAHLRSLLKCLTHSAQLLEGLVDLDALFLDLLLLLNKLFLLSCNTLRFTRQLCLHLL